MDAPLSMHGTRRIISSSSDSSNDNNCSSDADDEEYHDAAAGASDLDPSNMLDQDEDVIHAAEEVQEEDLDEVAQLAGLKVTVTNAEQKATSTALSKVSVVIYNFKHCTDHA